MSLKSNFNDLLKQYLAVGLIEEEVKKRNYFINKVDIDKGWKGGEIPLPMESAEASSIGFEGLVDSSEITQSEYIKPRITRLPELTGSLLFDQRDLEAHGDLKKSFLKILPGKVEKFVERMSERAGIMMLADGSICSLTADGEADGTITVDVPSLLTINEKVEIKSSTEPKVTGYVKSIDPNTKEVRIVETMKGTDYIDLTAYKATEQAKVYLPGALASGFTSLKKQLLPASLGGSDTFFGVDKADATILNANRYDGSSMTSTNFLDKLFEFYLDTLYVGKMGNANEALMNLKHLGKIIPKLEGSRRFAVADKSAGYGFRKVTLIGPEGGEFTITGVRDMPTDLIYMLDWNTIKVFSDQFIERIKNPDGLEYYTERVAGANGGYRHICDHRLYAEAAVLKPSANGVIYGVQA